MAYVFGAEFKLDVGLYRLDQQVACQRYRQTTIDAITSKVKALAMNTVNAFRTIASALRVQNFAFAPAVA